MDRIGLDVIRDIELRYAARVAIRKTGRGRF